MKFNKPDWHGNHAAVWRQVVQPRLPANRVRWLEIGSMEGRSAAWTLDNMLRAGDELVCVDIWASKQDEAAFDENVGSRAIKQKGTSESYLLTASGEFDVVYIDGSHNSPDVLSDAVLSWRLLKKQGGIMIFDDYHWRHPCDKAGAVDPRVAIDAFVACHETQIAVLHRGFQVIVQRLR